MRFFGKKNAQQQDNAREEQIGLGGKHVRSLPAFQAWPSMYWYFTSSLDCAAWGIKAWLPALAA